MNTLPQDAPRVLIVDDEPDLCELVAITLRGMGLPSDSAGTLGAAKQALSDTSYRLCLCDLRLPDGSGLELIEHIQRTQPQLPVAMITAHGDVGAAVAAMKAGAFDFVNKPVNVQALRGLIDQALRLSRVRAEPGTVPTLIGDSPAMQALRVMVAKLARSQAPVFIRGESGVGKERVARLIHAQGPRAGGPFVPVNCGAIPEHLLESELFGHVKGSFTGASQDREGLFQTAAGGTLFLDEVGDLPFDVQPKLLRFLEQSEILPVGDTRPQSVDVRVLAATNADLEQRVAEGKFREDLYYRLSVIRIHIPPLRQRRDEIPHLASFFLRESADRLGKPDVQLSAEVLSLFASYWWPGNVRQLRNEVQRAVALATPGSTVVPDQLSPDLTAEAPPAPGGSGATAPRLRPGQSLAALVDEIERGQIEETLAKTGGNIAESARVLGLTRRGLYLKLKRLGIDAATPV